MSEHQCNHDCQHEGPVDIEEQVDEARRSFLKEAVIASGGAATVGTLGVTLMPSAFAQGAAPGSGNANHYFIPASDRTVHWGYFSRSLKPLVEVESGDFFTM